MEKPYIICHMLTTLDGKIMGQFSNESEAYTREYYQQHKNFHADAFLCGRVTMENSFTHGYSPDFSQYRDCYVERTDFIGEKGEFYAIAIDPKGRLGWQRAFIEDEDSGYDQARIIEVLCENVKDEYLCDLKSKGISYIFGGKEKLDLALVMHKLKMLFQIQTVLLEGGGMVNGGFMQADLVDELSLILVPMVECTGNTLLCEAKNFSQTIVPKQFHILDVQIIQQDGLWLRYKR